MGQPGQGQQRPGQVLAGCAQGGHQVLLQGHIRGLFQQLAKGRRQWQNQQQNQHRQGPGHGVGGPQPAPQQHAQQGHGLQAAAQVVEDLPARQGAQAIAFQASTGLGRPGQEPRQQLPVTADPALAALDVGAVAGRVLLEQLHIAEQPGAGVAALDQVMAEDPVVGEAPAQDLLEGVYGIDALADEGAFLEQVLIDVRYGAGIGVDPGVAGEQPGIGRTGGARQADADPRLENPVAADDAPAQRVGQGPVQGVVHGSHALLGHVPGQLGVAVQGDHVGDFRQCLDIADDQRKTLPTPAAQQGIEVFELAALAFVAHPAMFRRVPQAWPVQQVEALHGFFGVLQVQRLDPLPGQHQQAGIGVQGFAGGVEKVAEQGEIQLGVAVGQEAHFQPFHQLLDIRRAADQAGHRHQGPGSGSNAFAVVQARQDAGGHGQGHQAVDQADGQPAGEQQRRHRQQPQPVVAGSRFLIQGTEEGPGEQG